MSETSRTATDGPICPRASTEPLCAALAQLLVVLEQVEADVYRQAGIGHMEGSIGGHVRHVLDHIRALVNAVGHHQIDYDHRRRDTPVETDPAAAVELARELTAQLKNLDASSMSRPITVCAMLSDADGQTQLPSTLGRELAFVLSHTIHHFALLGAMARAVDITLPEHFGYAPSTIAYRKSMACAQ